MEQRLLDDDLLEELDRQERVDSDLLVGDDDDIWSQQSEEDEMKSWEIGFEIGERAAQNDIVSHWNDGDY